MSTTEASTVKLRVNFVKRKLKKLITIYSGQAKESPAVAPDTITFCSQMQKNDDI